MTAFSLAIYCRCDFIDDTKLRNTANLNTLIQRYEDNFEWINNAEHDEIFKWRAVRCFQDVWFSEEVEDMTFAEKFKAATKECSVLLDNGQVSPTNGIVKMAEQEPDEVERLFVEVLFADDQGNLQLRQDHVEEFLDGIEAVRERTFPSYWKYGQNRHCAFTYLALYAPEENYIYKYSEAEEFAKHIEYGIDIGSGQTFKLSAYYGMCDLVVDALRTRPALREKHCSMGLALSSPRRKTPLKFASRRVWRSHLSFTPSSPCAPHLKMTNRS